MQKIMKGSCGKPKAEMNKTGFIRDTGSRGEPERFQTGNLRWMRARQTSPEVNENPARFSRTLEVHDDNQADFIHYGYLQWRRTN